jgi:hypothetical protein
MQIPHFGSSAIQQCLRATCSATPQTLYVGLLFVPAIRYLLPGYGEDKRKFTWFWRRDARKSPAVVVIDTKNHNI